MRETSGEDRDHPHHRGLWYAHGDVNGVDFWAEGPGKGRIVHRRFVSMASGPVYAVIVAEADWLDAAGRRVARERREMRFYDASSARYVDFAIEVTASDGPLVFGDTKEGTFALRLPPSVALTKGKGHILTAAGKRDGEAWGQPAAWVDYSGPIGNTLAGVAIYDDPGNPRHPTTWHVRDYGLFAANPFGLHDFRQAPPRTGDLRIESGRSVRFAYRVYLHRGGPEDARVAGLASDALSLRPVAAQP